MLQFLCRVHKPRVPNGPASLQYLARQAAQRHRASGPAQIHNDRPRPRSGPRPAPPARRAGRSPDRKAWPWWDRSPTPTPFHRPRIRRASARCSFPTDTVGANWERLTGDARSVWAQGAGGANKVRRSSQQQYRGPYPAMPCAPTGRCHRGMSGEHGRACQTRQSINNIVGTVVCRTMQTW